MPRRASSLITSPLRQQLNKMNDTANVSIIWRGARLQFSFVAKTWSQVQAQAADTIKRSGTRTRKKVQI